MPRVSKTAADPLAATRQSLVARLSDWGDSRKWKEFFETYWKLIHGVAVRAGLRDDEAQEVVQETCIAVAKNVSGYDRRLGSFKTWLLQMARWRIADQFRRRDGKRALSGPDDTRATAMLDRLPGAEQGSFASLWEEEWQRHAFDAALSQLKCKVDAKHFQVFDCAAIKGWTAATTARALCVNVAQVYLIKHRLTALLKKELKAIER